MNESFTLFMIALHVDKAPKVKNPEIFFSGSLPSFSCKNFIYYQTPPVLILKLCVSYNFKAFTFTLVRNRNNDKNQPHLHKRVIHDIPLLLTTKISLWFSFITHKSFAFY